MSDVSLIRQRFRELLKTLEKIDEIYLSEERRVSSEDDIAEGYRNLLHILRRSLDFFMELEPTRPEFRRLAGPSCKTQGDCPDTIYHHTRVQPNAELLIRGQRADEAYLSFTLHTSRDGVWSDDVCAALNQHDIEFNDDGTYEIHVSPTPRPGNWMQSNEFSDQLVVRQYFEQPRPAGLDPTLERFRPIISWGEGGAVEARRFGAERIGQALEQIAAYLRVSTYEKVDIGRNHPDWFSTVPNVLGRPRAWSPEDGGGGNGSPDIAYSAGFFMLGPDEALVVRGVMPECDYASVVLANRFLQSLDYREHQICLNRSSMRIADDGHFRVIVSAEDPGLPNWLDSEGRPGGIIFWRFILPTGVIAPIEAEVVKLETLKREGSG